MTKSQFIPILLGSGPTKAAVEKNEKTSREAISRSRLATTTVVTAAATAVLMTVYEMTKQVISPSITIWQSHAVTIFFTTMLATCSAYVVSKWLLQANEKLEMKVSERAVEINRMAHFDSLTGLPNHAAFTDHLRNALAIATEEKQTLALLVIDINHLHDVNDVFGFEHGDTLLKEVSVRVRSILHRDAVMARMRGDELAVLLPVKDQHEAEQAANQILITFRASYPVSTFRLNIGATIGVSLFPQHGTEAGNLMRHADVAMQQAKKSAREYAFYEAEFEERSSRRLTMAGELRQAIERDQLVLHYQPKIDMSNGSLRGVEALVRWTHPTRGMIRPDEFISLAEQTGLITPLTEWVLGSALRQSSVWRRTGLALPVAVNLSARNLREIGLEQKISGLLSSWGVEPDGLELEITEGAVMDDPQRALATLTRLSEMGIRLYIDDFGTGYSSLGYLKKLPVNAIKIDKSFVFDMLTDMDSAAIVRSTISLAHELTMQVVAEGVEKHAVWTQLAALGCDMMQGYYISKPLPVNEFNDWLTVRGRY